MDQMMPGSRRMAPAPARPASSPMPRRRPPLMMPEDMEDQPPMAQIEEAKRRRDMGEAYEKARTKKYAKGGVTRADGCVKKGHTKGRMV